jgi:hypothetical protein
MFQHIPVVVLALLAALPQPSAARPAAGDASPRAIDPAGLTVVLGCPNCGNQRSYRVSDNATQSVTDSWSGGGCGRSFRVHVSRGMVQGVWK